MRAIFLKAMNVIIRNKNFSLVFLSLILLSCFFLFSYKSAKQLFHYYSLSLNAPIVVTGWDVQQLGKNRYALIADFVYVYQDKEFKSTTALGVVYPNPWAAAAAVKRYSTKEFICWFSPKKLDHPFLTKKFPLHSCLSSLILAAILLYFCGLALYSSRRGQKVR